jgi:hypothetical protein
MELNKIKIKIENKKMKKQNKKQKMKITNLLHKKMLSIVAKIRSKLTKWNKGGGTSSNNTKGGHKNIIKARSSNMKGSSS